jgi:hypothetical protein
MKHGRWYPTCVALPDGRVMVTAGYDEYGDHNRLVEIYNPSSGSWTVQTAASGGGTYTVGASSSGTCAGAGSPSYSASAPNLFLYPRMHLMPTGNSVVAGMLDDIRLWVDAWHFVACVQALQHYDPAPAQQHYFGERQDPDYRRFADCRRPGNQLCANARL